MSVASLAPHTWPFTLDDLPESAYLVGGSIRDALLERPQTYWDLDFVMPVAAVETARSIAQRYGAGFVVLDDDRQIARVVFAEGTADFAQQVGDDLHSDLQRRDFTVNAIAYQPHQRRFADPLGGRADVQQRALRAICADNLRDDPLRLLRAYRQCAQLGLALTPDTRRMVRQLAPELGRVAAERVHKELDLLLATQQGADWLEAARCDGVLRGWLPRLQRHHSDQLAVLSTAIATLEPHWPTLNAELDAPIHGMGKGGALPLAAGSLPAQPLGDRGTWRMIARLALVLGPDPDAAVQDLQRLKYSRLEVRAVGLVLRTLAPEAAQPTSERWRSRREQYRCFQAVGASFPALVTTAIARGKALDPWLEMIARWQTPHDPLVHPQPLVSGRDLMKHLQIAPGPHIGQLLTDLELAHIDEQIHTPAEAIALAQQWLETGQMLR